MLNRDLVGARVRCGWEGFAGTVVKYEPLGAGLCDALVERDDGAGPIWVASRSLKRLDGLPIAPRGDVQRAADEVALRQLQDIRAAHVRDFGAPWPGCEHGKAIVGQSIDGAIADVKGRLHGPE